MTSASTYIEESHRFVSRWRIDTEQLGRFCEECWEIIQREQGRKNLAKISPQTPRCITEWCDFFKKQFDLELPEIVGAAAALRIYFTLFLSYTILRLPPPRRSSWKMDNAIATSPDWESAIKEALADIYERKEALNRCYPEWQITAETPVTVILDHIKRNEDLLKGAIIRSYRPKLKITSVQPLADSGYLIVPADRINKATIEAFAHGAMDEIPSDQLKPLGGNTTFWRGYTFGKGSSTSGRDKVMGVIGFRHEPDDRLWNLLCKNGALAIKAQYALWARAYAETGAKPGVYISLTISQFCDDIGFVRKKRAHTRQNKETAAALIELLTEMELLCVYQPPSGPIQRIRGPIWARGIISEELQGYGDIFGKDITRDIFLWVPTAFSYAPGPFFANETWRAYNRYIALVGEGLLKLRSDNTDKYAVIVGGYLAILARMNGYRKFRINVRTLLEKTGMWNVDGKRNPGRMRKKLEDALDRLCEVKVIKRWEITSIEIDIDADNLDDPDTLRNLSEPTRWARSWLSQTVIVDWPGAIKRREEKLKEGKERHLKKLARKNRRNNSHTH